MRYTFADCLLDTEAFTLHRGRHAVHIRPKVYRTLIYLLENRHRVVSRQELCDIVWNGRFISNTTIESTVMTTRRAVGDSGDAQRIIRTLPIHGYRFIADVVPEDLTHSGSLHSGRREARECGCTVPGPEVYPRAAPSHAGTTVIDCSIGWASGGVEGHRSKGTVHAAKEALARCRTAIEQHQGRAELGPEGSLRGYFEDRGLRLDGASRAYRAGMEVMRHLDAFSRGVDDGLLVSGFSIRTDSSTPESTVPV